MQDKDAIPFQHWSLKIGRADPVSREAAPVLGEIVTAIDDLHQAIWTLILTPLGSVPTEPLKGCDLEPYIDRTLDIAIPNVTSAIWDALTIWEPRVSVQDIVVEPVAFAHLSCAVYWRPRESVLDDLIVTTIPVVGDEEKLVA